jgi:hypothetical protein
MSKINKIAMREVLRGLSVYLAPTGFGVLLSYVLDLVDRLQNDQDLEEIQRQVDRLERAIGKDPKAIEGSVAALLALAAPADITPQLRRAQSCLVIMRALTTSESAMEWVPQIEYDDAIALLEPAPARAVLLPERPRPDLEALLTAEDIAVVWRTDDGSFADNAAGRFI